MNRHEMKPKHTIRWTKLLTITLTAVLVWTTNTSVLLAQAVIPIVYNRLDAQGNYQLWQINPDGTNARQLPVGFAFPAWSKDGRTLAITGPARPNVLSWNMFAYDPATGNRRQVTHFEDMVNTQAGLSSFGRALFNAFSPDGQRVAVCSYYVSNYTSRDDGTSSTVTPALEVYGIDGTRLALVAMTSGDNPNRGNGVDWAPNQDVLVYPHNTSVPNSPYSVVALFLVRPVTDASGTGQYRQLTFPQVGSGYATNGEFYVSAEEDFQPAFSPDGRQVAFIRATVYLSASFAYLSAPSLHIVNFDGTGDREIIRFQPGTIISHVSWSPDGSRLVFDVGRQAHTGGSYRPLPDPNTVSLYMINTEGSGFHQLTGPPSLFPAWNPRAQ